ncbi:flagellar protein FliT [Pantoea sp. A4]|uniref:flagellar protein FliT n=1 Tax=Pantoea sp. A4 TaxID=1225184 RepID=UPI0003747A09|nr:flagellar protein FliT [Pantoea sp. A4]
MNTTWQQVLQQSNTLLQLASIGEWDSLIALRPAYSEAVQALPLTALDTRDQLLFTQIRDNDQQLKQLMANRMNELTTLIGQSSNQKSVMNAYGKQGGQMLLPRDNG